MNGQFDSAWRLHLFLSARNIPYAIIGGIAVQRWGEPRLTRDVDLTVLLPPGREEAALREIVDEFPPRIDGAVAFALEHRVLPIDVPGGAEDLVIHKALAGRPQDLLDIEGIVARQGAALDVPYVRRWLEELARLAEDPEVLARFERAWTRHS